MKNIMVTGGEGYIGMNLCNYLRSAKIESHSYDLLSDFDIRDSDLLWEFMKESEIDGCVHLAALPGIAACDNNPLLAIDTNIEGTAIVASHCKLLKVPLVFASSFAVNGGHGVYADTKYIAEKLVLRNGGKVARIANVFGGDNYIGNKRTVVARLLDGSFKLEGDGTQTRDFIHVYCVVGALYDLLKEPSGVYKVCTGLQTSINDLVKLYDLVGQNNFERELQRRGCSYSENHRHWSKLV